ncbi:NAD-dependent DNA ligase LigA [Microbulbifer sp.]|uniref:NAD-dependent DNA ligase LigA n=1 Tax=Microbulbifer sp. TaxID=1908541 RepID=UPI003F3B6A69
MDFKRNPHTDFKDIDKLGKKEAAEEIRALREGINYHDHLYYVKDSPQIADAVYDKLFQRLQDLEEAFPNLKSGDSPTVRVGAEPVSQLKKIKHKVPLLSLQASLDEKNIESFLKTARKKAGIQPVKYVLEPKFDGLSVEVIYEKGRFKYGTTRGNGEVGEDISHNLKTIHALPLSLQHRDDAPATLAVRGEVFMPRDGFMALNKRRVEHDEEPFANPRNAAAGLMRQYKSRQVAGKPLSLFFYEILALDGELPPTHEEVLEQLSRWGLKTSPLNESASSLKQIENYHHKLAERRDHLDYEIDGIVIKVDDHNLREALGTRDRNPRWAIAWKFEPRKEVTQVEDIAVQVGRTGILTPVALLQPVDVGGVTLSRATLHNEGEVQRKDIRVGGRVRIIRAGDVIPEVEKRVVQPGRKRGKVFKMPKRCPVCNSQVVREGAYHLGAKAADQLVRREMVHNLADLYTLDTDDFKSLDGFAERSATQLYDAIQGAKEPRLDRFLFALGIPRVGRKVAKQLAGEFLSLEKLADASEGEIAKIPGIGAEVSAATANFFADDNNREVLERMHKSGVRVQSMPRRGKQPLKGKTFVFSGGLDKMTRDEAKEHVEALGARTTSSISGETDYLVVGEGPGSKLDEAKEKDVKRIDEKEFLKLLGDF